MVPGKLGEPGEVGSDGSLVQAFEMDEAGVILIPLCGGEVPVMWRAFLSWCGNHDGHATPFQPRRKPALRTKERRHAALFNRVPGSD